MNKSIEKIDKCSFCDKKAEYFRIKADIFRVKWDFLCNEHRLIEKDLK